MIQCEDMIDLRVRGREEAVSFLAIINTRISGNRVWFLALMSFSANFMSRGSL